MKTVQMTLDDDLVTRVDGLVRKLNTTRSEFTRRALRHAVAQMDAAQLIRDIPSEVLLSKADGMDKDCAINFDHLQPVTKEQLGSLISSLSVKNLQEVRGAIRLPRACRMR